MDSGTATFLAACVTTLGVVVVAWLTGRQDRRNKKLEAKIIETHKQVSVNGGKSDPPTVLDYLSNLRQDLSAIQATQGRTNLLVAEHIADSATDKAKLAEVVEHLGLT